MNDDSQQHDAWRQALDWRVPSWCQESGVHCESWSINGEACITGLDPPFAGGAELPHVHRPPKAEHTRRDDVRCQRSQCLGERP